MYYNKDGRQDIIYCQKEGGKTFSLLMIIYVILSFLVQSILLGFTTTSSTLYIAVCSSLSTISIAIVILYQCLYKQKSFEILSINKFKIINLIPSILLAIGMFLGLGWANIKFSEILSGWGINMTSPEIILDSFGKFILYSFTLALFPAISEELLFRGALLSSLKDQSIIKKSCIIGLCFALYHCNLAQFIYQFIYGTLLSLLALNAKSIFPCIISHFINNFAIICFNYFNIHIDLLSIVSIIIGLVALSIFVLLIFNFIKKGLKKSQNKKTNIKEYLIHSLFGIIICIMMLILALL